MAAVAGGDSREVLYDKLVVATGCSAALPADAAAAGATTTTTPTSHPNYHYTHITSYAIHVRLQASFEILFMLLY